MKTPKSKSVIRANQAAGIRAAYYESTGRKAKTTSEARRYFGLDAKPAKR